MNEQAERFQANADRMERMARGAHTDAERQVFLGFADTWRRMALDADLGRGPEERALPPQPRPDLYVTHAQEMEHLARAARSGEERELFLDLAARWRQMADDAQNRVIQQSGEIHPRH